MIAAGLIGGVALLYYLTKPNIAEDGDDADKQSLTFMDKTLLMALQARFPE